MTPQEAIQRLKNMYDSDNPFMHGRRIEIEEAIKALEKQTPKKPFIYKCPNCQNDRISVWQSGGFDETKFDYCPDCGQKLDWGGE